MSNHNKLLILLAASFYFLFGNVCLHAQSPTWETNLNGTINWQKITPLGTFIISTTEGIKGLDPETGKETWSAKKETGLAPESSFQMIQQTSFFQVITNNNGKEDLCIIESQGGKVLFSSAEAGLEKVNSYAFLYLSGAILVIGSDQGTQAPSVFMIDMLTGKKQWGKPADFGIITAYKDLGNNECIVSTGFFVIKINVKTGEEIWKKVIDPKMEKMAGLFNMLDKGTANLFDPEKLTASIVTTPFYPEGVFVTIQTSTQKQVTDSQGKTVTQNGIERNYMGFNIQTGEPLWPSLKKLPGPIGIIYTGEKGLVVSVGEYPKNIPNLVTVSGADIHCFDYATGESMWGKKGNGINIKGGVLRTITEIDGNILLVSGKDNNFMSLVKKEDGADFSEKDIKVSGQVTYVSRIGAGILYATNEEVNIVQFSESKKVFEKSFQSDKNLLVEKETEIVLFQPKDQTLYTINKNTGVATPLGAPIVWEGKEQATSLEETAEGYLVRSDQHLALISAEGKVLYNKYFPPPAEPSWKQALYYASAVFATYRSMIYTMNAGVYGAFSQSVQVNSTGTQVIKDVTQAVSDAYGDAAKNNFDYAIQLVKRAGQRYTATQATQQYVYILTSPDKKTTQLIRVDKKTGEILNTIDMNKEKKPLYEVDGVENRVFYKSGSTQVQGYQYK